MPTKEAKNQFDPALVLKDTKNFPDDLEIPIGNGGMWTMGALRAYNQATEGSIQAELEKGRKELEAERRKIDAASQSVAKLYVEVEKQRGELDARAQELARSPKGGAKSSYNDDPLEEVLANDPVYARLSKTIAAYDQKLADLNKKLDDGFGKVSNTLNEVGSTYLQERYEKDYDAILAKEDAARPKDLSLESLYKYANDNGIKKRNGIIDLNRAYDQLTQPARMKLEVEKAREQGRAEALKERDLKNMMPQPTQGLTIPGLDNIIHGKAAPKNLDEAFAAASNDPSMFGIPNQ